jgi:hypothetical protein
MTNKNFLLYNSNSSILKKRKKEKKKKIWFSLLEIRIIILQYLDLFNRTTVKVMWEMCIWCTDLKCLSYNHSLYISYKTKILKYIQWLFLDQFCWNFHSNANCFNVFLHNFQIILWYKVSTNLQVRHKS